LADAQVIAAEAATASAAVITPAPASAPAVAASVAPLTKAERKEVFVEQRAAELKAAGKPVNTVALEKKFDELAKTTEGRAQITTVVQRAEPAVLQAIGPAEVPAALLPAGLGAPAAPTTAARTITTPQNVRPEELARGLFPDYVGEAETISPIGAGGGPAGGGPAGGGPAGGGPTTGGATGATGADGQDDGGETPEERQTRLANEREAAREEADRVRRGRDARSTMAAVLNTYGLGELTEYVYDLIARETVNINNPDAIIFAIREQPAYQRRFAGNAARLRAGLSELSPAEYIGLENQFRQTLRSNGLPANFYDQPDDFKSFIEGDVSNSELNERVQQGYRAVADADPAVKEQMRNLYGVSEGQLAAYFLDPQRTAPLLTRQAQAANIAARGLEQGGMQLTGAFAEDLARRGITEQQARAGFAEVGGLGELKQTFAGETALSDEQLAGAAFGIDVAAQQELERKRRMRTAEFAGGGSFARTTGETSGSISTSVGKAQ
jgi:hypothetical protein